MLEWGMLEWGRWSGEAIPFCCSALRKVESLMPLGLGASDRTDRGAIRPCSGLNTPLFLPFENGKKSWWIDRGIRLSNFSPKSQQKGIASPLRLFFSAGRFGF